MKFNSQTLSVKLVWIVSAVLLLCTTCVIYFDLHSQDFFCKQQYSQQPAVVGSFYRARRPFVDPYEMYPECVGYHEVPLISSLCNKVFFDAAYDLYPAPSQHNVSLATLFDQPHGAASKSMLNEEAAKEAIRLDAKAPYRVVTMSLFGKNTRYTRGLFRNMISLYLDPQFQGWKLRVYYDHTIPNQLTHLMRGFDVQMYHVQYQRERMNSEDTSGSFWRFMVILDPKITRYIMRDADMKLSVRDASAVNEWIDSKLPFHVQRDHQAHSAAILGGMWGSVGGYFDPHSKELFDSIPKESILNGGIRYGGDQDWLREIVWPKVKSQTISHDVFFCRRYDNVDKRGYPQQRANMTDFVGNMYRAEENWMGVTSDTPADPVCLRNATWTTG